MNIDFNNNDDEYNVVFLMCINYTNVNAFNVGSQNISRWNIFSSKPYFDTIIEFRII